VYRSWSLTSMMARTNVGPAGWPSTRASSWASTSRPCASAKASGLARGLTYAVWTPSGLTVNRPACFSIVDIVRLLLVCGNLPVRGRLSAHASRGPSRRPCGGPLELGGSLAGLEACEDNITGDVPVDLRGCPIRE